MQTETDRDLEGSLMQYGSALPPTLSELITVALESLTWAEKQPEYIIDPTVWHEEYLEHAPYIKCLVGVAGCVMAHVLHVEFAMCFWPANFLVEGDRLSAISHLSRGELRTAARSMGRADWIETIKEAGLTNVTVPEYDPDAPEVFHVELAIISNRLERMGM